MAAGLDLVEGLLVVGLVAVVPAALQLHPDIGRRWAPAVTGGVVAAALSLQGRVAPAALAAAWVIVTGLMAAAAGWRWLRRDRALVAITRPVSLAYLAVGAIWLLLHALGVEPVGVRPPFVLLTAVHFHYAGFTATLLASLVFARTVAASPRLAWFMVAAVVGAPPIVAAGFTFFGPLQVVGALLLTAGLFALSWLTLRVVVPRVVDRLARWLLGVSAVAVLVPMVLAVQWAVGWNFDTPALSIPMMARTHGVANALGFALCGVLGWRRLLRGESEPTDGRVLAVP